MTDVTAHYVLFHPDGRGAYRQLTSEECSAEVLRGEIPGVSLQGMGRWRAWFVDDFVGQESNPLADAVFVAIGPVRGRGWRTSAAMSLAMSRR